MRTKTKPGSKRAGEKKARETKLREARAIIDQVLKNLHGPNAAELVAETTLEGWREIFERLEETTG